jgi:hypothetical protein
MSNYPKMLYRAPSLYPDAETVKAVLMSGTFGSRVVASPDEEQAALTEGWSAEPYDFIGQNDVSAANKKAGQAKTE